MEMIKIIGIGLIALVMAIILKQYKPEYALYISLLAGVFILGLSFSEASSIIHLLQDLSSRANIQSGFLGIILKITGIAILTEFAVNLCEDAGERTIAHKIDIGGKVFMITISLPIITSLLETIVKVLP